MWILLVLPALAHPLAVERLVAEGPAARPPPPAERGWDITHVELELRIDPDAHTIVGGATITATALGDEPGPLRLHADGPTLRGATVDGLAVEPTIDGDRLELPAHAPAGGSVTVRVDWTAPGNDTLDIGFNWSGDYAFSLDEPWGARRWLVLYDAPDDKYTATIAVTAPDDQVVVTNGVLVEAVAVAPGWTRTTRAVDFPIATYLLVVHLSDYVAIDLGDEPVAMTGYVRPDDREAGAQAFAATGAALQEFSARWVPYAFPLYNTVAINWSTAMEHTTATSFARQFFGTGYEEIVVVHEAAHHWWGDLVTLATWDDIWLNEGFASYAEVLYLEETAGAPAAAAHRAAMRESWRESAGRAEGTTVYAPVYLFGASSYDKGALILHMLRRLLGDAAFDQALIDYLQDYAGGVATSAEFEEAVEESSGQDLTDFFTGWLYQPGDPEFTVGYTQTELRPGLVQVDLHITQPGPLTWTAPMHLLLWGANGQETAVDMVAGGLDSTRRLCLDHALVELTADPDDDLLYTSLTVSNAGLVAPPLTCTAATPSPVTRSKEEGCGGCASASPAGGLLLGLLGLLGRRRLRR